MSSNPCHWQLLQYQLPFHPPFLSNNETGTIRKGVIIYIQDSLGHSGIGEISPFPSVHQETLAEAIQQLQMIFHSSLSRIVTTPFDLFENSSLFDSLDLYPSVQFGLEMVRFSFTNSQFGQYYTQHSISKRSNSLRLNGLVTGNLKALPQELEYFRQHPHSAIKLKVGRLSLEEDVARVEKIRMILGQKIELRLDANQSWSWEEALEFANKTRSLAITYVEEPLQQKQRLVNFFQETGIFYAWDESIRSHQPEFDKPEGLAAIIIKPSQFGCAWRSLAWVQYAQQIGIEAVFSSAFESGLGLTWIAFLAANFLNYDTTLGLDTYRWFPQDIIEPRFAASDSVYHLTQKMPQLCHSLLQQIEQGYFNSE